MCRAGVGGSPGARTFSSHVPQSLSSYILSLLPREVLHPPSRVLDFAQGCVARGHAQVL